MAAELPGIIRDEEGTRSSCHGASVVSHDHGPWTCAGCGTELHGYVSDGVRQAERPEPGTLWLLPNGDVVRLMEYRVNWHAEPFTGKPEVPSYRYHYVTGATGTGFSELPADAVVVWKP